MAIAGLNEQAGDDLRTADHTNQPAWQNAAQVLLISVLLLIPCFWQSRIQAGDLSSHLYNAWLATLINQGQAPGLWIEHRSNNVAFDVAMQWLLQQAGPGLAQRIPAAASVLIFGWGALAFISAIAGKNKWWFTVPVVWMATYGFFYEMGFFNFLLSFGLCLWYLTIFSRCGWRMSLAASPLLILAWIAHPFPAVWAAGMAAFLALTRNRQLRERLITLGLCVAILVAARFVLLSRYRCRWSWEQTLLVSGADQLLIFGFKYFYVIAPFALVSILLFVRWIKTYGWTKLLFAIPFELWVLNAAAVLLIPNDVLFPTYAVAFGYIANRLSLPAGIMVCALLAQVPLRTYEKAAMVAIAAAFCVMMYADTRELNRWEDSVDAQIAQLPSGQRVVSALPVLYAPVDPLWHMVDRACVGHCYSYGNYEPASRQFRVRAQEGNGIVFSKYADVYGLERAKYIVQARDLPLYLIYACHSTQWEACVRPLSAGEEVHRGMGTAPSMAAAPANAAPADVTPAAPSPLSKPMSLWSDPARRKAAAEALHQKLGGDAYGTVDEAYEGGPALVIHNRKATEEWATKLFEAGANSPTNELLWQIGFRNYLVTNGTDSWQMEIDEDPRYRSLFKDAPAPEKP